MAAEPEEGEVAEPDHRRPGERHPAVPPPVEGQHEEGRVEFCKGGEPQEGSHQASSAGPVGQEGSDHSGQVEWIEVPAVGYLDDDEGVPRVEEDPMERGPHLC